MNSDKLEAVEETIRRVTVEAGYESEDGLRSVTPKPGVKVRVEQVATEHEVLNGGILNSYDTFSSVSLKATLEVVVEHQYQESSADTSRFMPGDDRGRMPGRRTQQSRRPSGQAGTPGPTNSGPTTISPPGPGGHAMSYPPAQADHAPPPPYHYPPSTSYSGQRGSFYGAQYTMSPQQPPAMGMGTYPFSHGYQHPDPSLMSQTIHANYQSMISPYAYQQRHSSENNSAHSGYSNAGLYSPPTPPNNPGAFQPLRYPSPMPPSSQYPTYHQNPAAFSPSGMYQSVPPFNYPRPFPSSPDAEGQGTWWYLPHAVPSHQHQPPYDGTPSQSSLYQTSPYAVGYSQQIQDMDSSSAASPTGNPVYPMPSTAPSHSHSHSHVPRPPSTSLSPPPAVVPPPVAPPAAPPDPSLPRPRSPQTPGVTTQPKPTLTTSPNPNTATRKSYHPNPPAHRSEWVMWSGNVPPDATHDELWRFFNQKPTTPTSADPSSPSSTSSPYHSGVLSIFLISRSSCAFINYENEATLQMAINRFNGLPLRPNDPRCPRLVCRVRKKDDDLRAGVGGQRGVGMHTKWVKDNRGKLRSPVTVTPTQEQQEQQSDLESSTSHTTDASYSSFYPSSEGEGGGSQHQRTLDGIAGDGRLMRHLIPRNLGGQSSSGSYASTNSDMLGKYFPKRFFILKSLSQFDLDLSVEKGLWATQKHNEGILDQAYRTSRDVYLIFGVNKSGEFYGYARMAGSVKQGEHRVSWGPRTESSSSTRSSLSPVTGRTVQSDTIFEESVASPSRVLGEGFENLSLGASPDPRPPLSSSHSNRMQAYFTGSPRMVEDSPQPLMSAEAPSLSPGQYRMLDGIPFSVSGGGSSPLAAAEGGRAGVTIHPDERRTAPAELGQQHKKITMQTPTMRFSLDHNVLLNDKAKSMMAEGNFELDEDAPLRAMKNPSPESKSPDAVDRKDGVDVHVDAAQEDGHVGGVQQEKGKGKEVDGKGKGRRFTSAAPDGDATPASEDPHAWGDSFKVEWLCTKRLPFLRTRHLRNPWNHDREIKVSRDGTELEPGVGQQLLDEWEKYVRELQSGTVSTTTKEDVVEKPTPVKKGGSRLATKRNG